MIHRKSKMISFRLSPEEFELYHQACEPNGVASISELARTALHRLVRGHAARENHPGPPTTLFLEIRELRDRITTLSAEVERLNHRVDPHPTNGCDWR